MTYRSLAAPALVVLGTAVLLAPAETRSFNVFGDVLNLTQRDFRIRNAFTGVWANTNQTPDPDFPGSLGAELAIRKGVAEWGSRPHGSGVTDRTQDQLGSGGSNFDAFYAGRALVNGNRDANIISAIPGGGGAFAFTDLPIGDGWRIRYLNAARDWNDDPNGPIGGTSRLDIQGVAAHEYGHALGLDHSTTPGATMGQTTADFGVDLRSIEADDIAGLHFLYGALHPWKPVIDTYALPAPGTVRIEGVGFDTKDNDIWFTPLDPLVPGDGTPVIVHGVPSAMGGTVVEVQIPAEAGPGSIAVRIPGNRSVALSNVFPFDPQDTPWTPPETFGTPGMSSNGTPFELNWRTLPSVSAGSMTFVVTGADPGASFGLMVSGPVRTTTTTPYGDLLVGGAVRREAMVPFLFGAGAIEVALPPSAVVGMSWTYQAWAPDGGAAGGVLSNAIELRFTP